MATGEFGSEVVLQNGQYSFLVDDAIQKVWCNPEMDNQHIVAPFRITPFTGALNRVQVMMRNITLPSQSDIYHVFQIGQLHPLVLGLLQINPLWSTEQWISLADAINNEKLIADVYNDAGVQIPRFEVFYMYSNDRDLIIAIKQNKTIPVNYQSDNVYLRVYSNAYFATLKGDSVTESIYCYGTHITGAQQILDVQTLYTQYAGKKGAVYGFVNGYYVDSIDVFTTKVGDTVEFMYDSSIYKTVSFTVAELNNFVSTLDSKQKYLLHYAGTDDGTIDYQDDIDIFVINPFLNNRFVGVYYHRNSPDACRMVTHRDYSIAIPYFTSLANQLQLQALPTPLNLQNLKIRLNIRRSGYNRPLVFENNRIKELYKLNDSDILAAMLGTNAVVPEWQVANLEQSAYTQIMRAEAKDITVDLVEAAYGYNACSVLLGNTPLKTYDYSSKKRIDVPRSLTQNATAYEYDVNGLLIDFYSHPGGVAYDCVNNNCAMVEMISGTGTQESDVRFGTSTVQVPTGDNYRVYRCHMTANGPDNKWEDCTGSNLYTVNGNTLTWVETDYNPYIMVRTDATFLAYDLQMQPFEGNMHIVLTEQQRINDVLTPVALPLPLGELDVFLNGHSLIENIDYTVQFPEIVILNKSYLNRPLATSMQNVSIRFTGFCKADMTREAPEDTGWIKYGVLSKNKRYDIRDDKVLRIVSGGALYTRDDLKFSETSQDLGITNAKNGQPYMIRDIVVPMKNETNKETYAFRADSEIIDQHISDYLTLKLPETEEANPSAIAAQYELVSPFFARLIFDLQNDIIPASAISTTLSDNAILAICKPYEKWLGFDPIWPNNKFDLNYIAVHPTNDYAVVSLKFYQYQFLKRVNSLYGNGMINLSSFIMLAPAS